MSMAIEVRRPVGGPRSCTWADGRRKATYRSLAVARNVARRQGGGLRAFSCACGSVHIGHGTGDRW